MMESILRSMKRSAVFAGLLLCTVMVTAPMAYAATAVSSDGQEIQDAAFAEGITKALPFTGSGKLSAAMLAEDAGAPSYGEIKALSPATAGFGAESVIGADTRVRTYPYGNYPARATALITFTGGYCTGFFIGDNTVATAGHCVNAGGRSGVIGAWRTNVRVWPGYNAGSAPYGSFPARSGGLWTSTAWARYGNANFDYGVIKLSVNAGNTVGWYGFSWSSLSRLNYPAIVMGYAGDKSPAKSQWIGADKIRVSGTYQLQYATDTFGGQSGSAVWYDGGGPIAIAIHAYGGTMNAGTRITQELYNFLLARKNEP